jgi:hypothetical protein
MCYGDRLPYRLLMNRFGNPNQRPRQGIHIDDNPQGESMVDTDLALQKVQVYGETAGADVAVAPSKQRQTG